MKKNASIGRHPLRPRFAPAPFRVLFVHQNFPSPFANLAEHLAASPGTLVAAVGEADSLRRNVHLPEVLLFGYTLPQPHKGARQGVPPKAHAALTRNFEDCVQRGLAARAVFAELAGAGFEPDIIIGDPAWGELLFVRQVFPHTPLLARAENYFDLHHPLWDFDPEAPYSASRREALCTGHMASLRCWAEAQARYSATHTQHANFPPALRGQIEVLHEGIRTDVYAPAPLLPNAPTALPLVLPCSTPAPDNAPLPTWAAWAAQQEKTFTLPPDVPLVVYHSRVLEPHRGWHTFIRALPAVQQRHPQAQCVVVGRTHGGYGPPPSGKGQNWRDLFLNEVRPRLDFSRLHFSGNVRNETVQTLMRRAQAYVVPSCLPFPPWSPLEAMSCGAALVSSDTPALRELTDNGNAALLTNFFDSEAMADAVCRLFEDGNLRRHLGQAGRAHVLRQYDFATVCLPRWLELIERLRGQVLR